MGLEIGIKKRAPRFALIQGWEEMSCEDIRIIKLWENLHKETVEAENIGAFKKSLPWVPEATRLLNPAGQRPAKRA